MWITVEKSPWGFSPFQQGFSTVYFIIGFHKPFLEHPLPEAILHPFSTSFPHFLPMFSPMFSFSIWRIGRFS